MRYRYVPGETRVADPGMEFTDLPDTINHHWTKALLASPDGRKLYVGVGSNSNITENGAAIEYRRAAILEVDVASRGSRIYASGLRNPTGLQWEPVSGKLWTIVNERDEIGNDLVPDYLTSVREGGFGWPYSYFGQHLDSRVKPQRPDLVAKAIVPDYALGSTWLRWACSSTPATSCPSAIATAPSSASTAVGTAHRSAASRWSMCRSPTASPPVRRSRW